MPARGQGTKYQGSKWCRPERRLALYLRDGLACVWCGFALEEGAQLSLDHLVPHVSGGTNVNENLVTCCSKCNSSRGSRSVEAFATAAAAYLNHGIEPAQILAHIETTRRRPVDVAAAKALIAQRGSYRAALHTA